MVDCSLVKLALVKKRAALDLWANHVAVFVAQANGANITKLRR